MQFQDEGARIVEESIPAGLPSCDLTDDFLADLDQFIDSSLFEQPSGLLAGETPADASMDIPTEAGQLEAGSSLDPPADAAASNSDPRQRKLQSNRLAQARLRERKKARSQTMEAQLAETTAQLRQLQIQQQQLEARNTLLEHVARIHQGPAPGTEEAHDPARQVWQGDLGLGGLTQASEQGPAITLTGYGPRGQAMTIKEISGMSFEDLANVHTVYARKLGQCLLDITSGKDINTAQAKLQLYTTEANAMLICVAMANPKSFSSFHGMRLDGMSGDNSDLSDTFYAEMLAAVELTEAQQQDLMLLRRLFYGRLGQLLRERRGLLSKVQDDSGGSYWNNEPVQGAAEIAQQLRTNGIEEYRTYMQFASTFFRGIQTCKQHAVGIVYSYPWIPAKHKMLEVLAAQRGEPPLKQFLDGDGLEELQHAANWLQIADYLRTIDSSNLLVHVPLAHGKQTDTKQTPAPAAAAFPKTSFDILV